MERKDEKFLEAPETGKSMDDSPLETLEGSHKAEDF